MDTQHPLTDQHYASLQQVLERAANLVELLKRMDSCGEDVSEPLAMIQAQLAKVAAYKRTFFPHMP